MISTRFTKMLEAAAVSNAGGLGIMSTVCMSPDFIRGQIRKTRALTDRPFGINLIPAVAPASGIESQLESASRSASRCCRSSGVMQRPTWSAATPRESC